MDEPPDPPEVGGDWPFGLPPPDTDTYWWPALEQWLHDIAVIRTTLETIDLLGDNPELHRRLMHVVEDARGRLQEARQPPSQRVRTVAASALLMRASVDLAPFQSTMLDLIEKGMPRARLASMMKADAYEHVPGEETDPLYRYQLRPPYDLELLRNLAPWEFFDRLLGDLGAAIEDPDNYRTKSAFDQHVFRKHVALMFACLASIDPVFYGTQRRDPDAS